VLEKFGLQDKVKIQPMGGTREVDAAFRAGMIAGAVRSMKPGPNGRLLVDLPDLGIPFSMDLMAVKRDYYKNAPKTVEGMLKAYIEGVAALRTKKDLAYKVLGKYLGGGDAIPEAYEYAIKYLDRDARIEPAVIQTVLKWEGKGELPPGDFEVTFAISESPSKNARTPPKRVVHTQALTVPDFSGGLTTSSIVLARGIEAAPQQLTARQQMEQPFTIGGQKITPALTPAFTKSAELLFMFLVYNEGEVSAGKPDIEVGYTLTRGAEAKPFARMPNTLFNATTLPADFNLGAGHQVMVVQGVPLASLAPGDYKLAIAITDKTNSGSIARTVPFTVIP
jgi:hypothetical protein